MTTPDEKRVKIASAKHALRRQVWESLEANRATALEAYPDNVFDRIPHFIGCKDAAHLLARTPEFKKAKVIKVNASLAQQELRFLVLQRGKQLLVPEPMTDEKLGFSGASQEKSDSKESQVPDDEKQGCESQEEGCKSQIPPAEKQQPAKNNDEVANFDSKFTFYFLDPVEIAQKMGKTGDNDSRKNFLRKATSKKGMQQYGSKVVFEDTTTSNREIEEAQQPSNEQNLEPQSLPFIDMVITGTVAVSRNGVRMGKGKGYAEREWDILLRNKKVSLENTWVATTCHDLQCFDFLEYGDYMDESHDLGVHLFAKVPSGEVVRTFW